MSAHETQLLKAIHLLKSIHGGFLDPMCVVNTSNEIIHANLMMKQLLDLDARQLKRRPVFCNHLTLGICRKECGILRVLSTGANLRLHEAPALLGTAELRISMLAHPILDPWEPKSRMPIGALILVRDMTTEVQLQLKYGQLQDLLKEKEHRIIELDRELLALKIKHGVKGTEKTKAFTKSVRR